MNAQTILLLVVAIATGLTAAYYVASLGPPRHSAFEADYYCYELRQALGVRLCPFRMRDTLGSGNRG